MRGGVHIYSTPGVFNNFLKIRIPHHPKRNRPTSILQKVISQVDPQEKEKEKEKKRYII